MPQHSHEWDGFIQDGRIDKPLRADPDYIKRFEYEAQTIAQDVKLSNGVSVPTMKIMVCTTNPIFDRCNGRILLYQTF